MAELQQSFLSVYEHNECMRGLMLSLALCIHVCSKHYLAYLRLALCTILNAKPGAFAVLLGVVCSSWTVVNQGTSRRQICHPLGREDLQYVHRANVMISRHFSCKHVWCSSKWHTMDHYCSWVEMIHHTCSTSRLVALAGPCSGWLFWYSSSRASEEYGASNSRPAR